MTTDRWPADNKPSKIWPIYTRGNVGEVYPDVVLPLEWDLAGEASEEGWRIGATDIGFVTDSDFDGCEGLTFIGVFGGYAYFNASLMRLLGVRTPGLSVDLIDQQFLGDIEIAPYKPSSADRSLRSTARLVRSAAATLLAKKVPLVDEMAKRVDDHIAAVPPLDAATEVLWAYVVSGLQKDWAFLIGSHVTNSMRATIASGQLADLCEAKLGDPNLALILASGVGDVRSAGPAQAMWVLAKETDQADFDEAFAEFLTEFGHRGPNEFSIAGKDWAAYPEIALAAIDNLRGSDADRSPTANQDRLRTQREQALTDAHKKMGWQSKRLDMAIASTALWSRAREASKDEVIRAVQATRSCVLELLRRAARDGGVDDTTGPMLLGQEEFLAYLDDPTSMVEVIESRREHYDRLRTSEPPFAFSGSQPPLDTWQRRGQARTIAKAGETLIGAAGSPGIARGLARLVEDPSDPSALEPGDVLIAPITDPSWTPLFLSAQAVVVEVGAAMSHSMIVSRELGIPCVVGVSGATAKIADGSLVEVDGQAGTVKIIENPA